MDRRLQSEPAGRAPVDGLVGRSTELAELERTLVDAGRRPGCCVLITGPPGVGKSTLVRTFGATLAERNGVFAYGRHHHGVAVPYAAWAEALDAVVAGMEATSAVERGRWRSELAGSLGALAVSAIALVPALGTVLDVPATVGDPADTADGRHRLQRAAIRLVAVAASFRPLVLALDDLQWADHDSLVLLSELLAAGLRNVVVVLAHRSGDGAAAPVGRLGERLAGSAVHTVELPPLGPADLETLLTGVSERDPLLGEVAAEFHRRTGGNPLLARELLRRAEREGALTGSGAWDLTALQAMEVTASDAELLEGALDQLAPAHAAVIAAVACLGHEFDLDDGVAASGHPAETVGAAVWAALDLRLLEALDPAGRRIGQVLDRRTRYRLSHDRIAEAARGRLTEAGRSGVHLRVGRWLAARDDPRLFETARHLAAGGSGGTPAERARFADVERVAAEHARRQASFPIALACYRAGLALLGERRWSEHPELARRLHLGAAEAAFLAAEHDVLARLLAQADQVLVEPADRARLAFLRLKDQVARHELRAAIRTGLDALDELGHPLPRGTGRVAALRTLVALRSSMSRWPDRRLLALPRCTDAGIAEVQRILGELRNMSYLVRPDLFPLIVRKELDLVRAHGLVPSAAVALASYGVLLVLTGDLTGSQRFGEVGLLLADRPEFRESRPQVRFLHDNFIRPWRHPIAGGLSQLHDAVRQALDDGDAEYAGFLAAVLLYQSIWVGRPLAEVDALARSLIPEISTQRVPSSLCRSLQQLCLNLMGRSTDPHLLAGESGYDEREVLPAARRENDVVGLGTAAIMKLGLRFWSGDDAGAIPLAEQTAEHLDGLVGTPNVQLYHLCNALCRIGAQPRRRATARAVRQALALHRRWAAAAPANYAAPYELIQGVWARARGNRARAERHLDRAVVLAEQHQLPLIGALAHEEVGVLYAATARSSLSRHMTRAAHERWLSIGLTVRCTRLERAHPWLLGRDLVRSNSATVDAAVLHRLTQSLATAATPEALAEVVLGAAADSTGGARVMLLMTDGGGLVVRAVHEAGAGRLVDGDVSVEPDPAVIQLLERTDRTVVGPGGSVLAVPMRLRGSMIGALHVEYPPGHKPGPGHQDALIALCAQAAAPLWTVELEGRLDAAVSHRQSLLDVQSRFIPRELLRILDVDDLRRVRRGQRVERRTTVLISDIRGYTALVEGLTVFEAGDLASGFLRAVEVPIIAHNGLLQDVRGDEVLAVFDADPQDAIRAGLAMLDALAEHNRERTVRGSVPLEVGIGIHTGTVGLGLVGGVNRMALTVIGDAVNLAARVESATKRYGVPMLISDATRAELPDRPPFAVRRMERVQVVNRRQPVTIHEVYDRDPPALAAAKRAAQPLFDQAFARFDAGEIEPARLVFEQCRDRLPDDQVALLHLAHCAALAGGDGPQVPLVPK
jgi:predicted ATPase/class 3 adenylate cyclase